MYIIDGNNKIKLEIANTFFKKVRGFMFSKNINYCLCLPKCNSIHTFFMFKNIDVVMTDKNNNILYIYKNFNKNRIIFPKKNVYYTYEFPPNFINNYDVGKILKVED